MGANCEDDACAPIFEKCGGTFFNTSVACCDENTMCVVKNYFYAQCLTAEEAEQNVDQWAWDGRILDCEEMPIELMPDGSDDLFDEDGMYGGSGRRMLATDMGYGGYDMGYGSKGGYGSSMPAPYGTREFEMPHAEAPGPAPVLVDTTPEIPRDLPIEEMPAEMPATAPLTPDVEVMDSDLVLGDGCMQCAPIFGQCGDKGAIVSCCGEGLQCTKKHGFYAQCLPSARASRNVENFGWDGSVLECGAVML